MIEIQPPEQSDLAIYNPESGLNGYGPALLANELYWAKQAAATREEARVVPYEISSQLYSQLRGTRRQWAEIQLDPARTGTTDPEYVRKVALNSLAMGLFMRSRWNQMLDAGDAIGHGYSNYVVDMGEGNTGSSERIELKVHTKDSLAGASEIEAGAKTEQWYRTRNLYLKEVQPAEPTASLITMLLAHEVSVNFTELRTIYPYLPAQGAR